MRFLPSGWFLAAVFACGPAPAASLPDFLRSAYATHATVVAGRLSPRLASLCAAAGVPDTSAANRRALLPVLFLHGLLTTTDAVDGRRGGAFGTAYFWHWVTPNPRHSLRRLPDSAWLAKLPPPPGFARYRSWADVDRLPELYLGDLATEAPRYWHRRYGTLQTFGWCSEREMAFGALLAAWGLKGKIKQEGIHVWTEVVFDLVDSRGRIRPVAVAFDNTFDTVEAWPLAVPRARWAKDFGDGAQVAWYNQVAASEGQAAKVKAIAVGPEAAKRMTVQIAAWASPMP